MKRAMVISPAGNPEKLRFAVKFGADEVYFGGELFNLRVQADNFGHDELAEAARYCREHSVKTTFLMNAFLHDADVREAERFVSSIKDYGFDAVMVSDPGMLMILKDSGIQAEFHLSTQMNTLNSKAAKFWMDAGFSRIVLARETSLDEIRMIKESTGASIEVFAHGRSALRIPADACSAGTLRAETPIAVIAPSHAGGGIHLSRRRGPAIILT